MGRHLQAATDRCCWGASGLVNNWNDAELRQLLYCVGYVLRDRRNGKPPGPQPWLAKLIRRLELEVAVSSSRHETDCDQTDLDDEDDWVDWIDAKQAVGILRWNIRKVQRRAEDGRLPARKGGR